MSGCSTAGDCFISETVLPDRGKALAAATHGQAGRELLAAVFDGDGETAVRLLGRDRALGTANGGPLADVLSIAIARCDKPLVQTLLQAGVPPDGPAGNDRPLHLALRSKEPWYAETLLKAGASPNPLTPDGRRALDDAIYIGSQGAVRLLLQHGARLDQPDRLGITPLQTAVDAHQFAIAELLLDAGADPWAADKSGGTLGWGLHRPDTTMSAEDRAAKTRLLARIKALGWPDPAPSPQQVKVMAAAGGWPPARARH